MNYYPYAKTRSHLFPERLMLQ